MKEHRRGVAAALALALVLTACGGSKKHAHPKPTATPTPGQVAVTAGAPATLSLAGGVIVTVPAGSMTGNGTLAGKTVTAPAPPPKSLLTAGVTYQLEVTGAQLTGPISLHFPAPPAGAASDTAPQIPVLAYYDTAHATWIPVASTYNAASHSLTATSTHLSVWSVFRLDTKVLLDGMNSLAQGFLGLGDHTEQPVSDGRKLLAGAGVRVTSSSGSLVKWSAGISNSATHVKVANNRGYAIGITYPASWSSVRFGGTDDIVTALTDWAAGLLTGAARNQHILVLAPGKGAEFTVPAGGSGQVSALPNVEAYLLSGLLYGLETLNMVWDRLAWLGATEVSKTRKAVKLAMQSKTCTISGQKIAAEDVSTARGAGRVFRDAADLATGCLGDAWQVAYGLRAGVAAFVVGVLLWLVDGVKLVLEGLRAAIDTAMYFDGYNIFVRQAAPAPDPYLIRFDGIGPVSLGMGPAQLSAAGYSGSPVSFGCLQYSKQSDPVYVEFAPASNSVIAATEFQSAAYHTTVGIHVGSSLVEVRSAYAGYPIEERMDGSMGQGSNGIIVTGPGGYIGFSIDSGVVSGIKVGNSPLHTTATEYSC